MRTHLLIVAAVALACRGEASRSADTAMPTVATGHDPIMVQRIIDSAYARFSDALIKGDAAAASAMYANDAILLPANYKVAKGRNAVDKTTASMLRSAKVTAVTFKTTDLVVTGDYAIETGAYDMTAQGPPPKGTPVRDVGKYVTIWKRQADGSWKIFRDIANTDQPPR